MKYLMKYIAIPLILIGFSACGYHLTGQGNSLPEHLKKISVPVFANKTFEYGLESIITQEVISSLNRRPGIEVVESSQNADALFHGEILEYKYTPTLNSQREVTQYYIHITASVKFMDLIHDKVYWENASFIFHQIYKVTDGVSSIQASRQKAWKDAAEGFAESVTSVLLEGF